MFCVSSGIPPVLLCLLRVGEVSLPWSTVSIQRIPTHNTIYGFAILDREKINGSYLFILWLPVSQPRMNHNPTVTHFNEYATFS
tara:strand:+ start:8491 stop:8742 length:252 start_codon:yes stop_codon:yes gene_type:complete